MRFLKWFIGIAVLFVAVCSTVSYFGTRSSDNPKALTRNLAETLPPVAGEVWGSDNEEQANQIIEASERMLAAQTGTSRLMKRDAHPKQHGCARAAVDLDSRELPARYRVGVFAPQANASGPAAHYLAWARFSNGSPTGAESPDLDKDIRGFAIKLMNVQGSESGSQDFVLSTSREFFSKNGQEYAGFNKALSEGGFVFLSWLAVHPAFLYRLQKSRIQIANVLHQNYFSTVPYRLGGENSMRFSTTPCVPLSERDRIPSSSDATPNYLRERLVSRLKTGGDECFNFYVQPNQNPERQIVENPTLAWDEQTSPLYWVGKITFQGNQNDIDSPEQNALCENLSFSPWHSLPETRPLGQINRIRKVVYAKISEDRHVHNGVPESEPKDHHPCAQSGNTLCRQVSP